MPSRVTSNGAHDSASARACLLGSLAPVDGQRPGRQDAHMGVRIAVGDQFSPKIVQEAA